MATTVSQKLSVDLSTVRGSQFIDDSRWREVRAAQEGRWGEIKAEWSQDFVDDGWGRMVPAQRRPDRYFPGDLVPGRFAGPEIKSSPEWHYDVPRDVFVYQPFNRGQRQQYDEMIRRNEMIAQRLGECVPAVPLKLKSQPTKEQTANMQLFEYAVIYVPTDDDGNVIKAESKIVTEPKTALAKTAQSVRDGAIQEIAGQDLDLDFVKVVVRPFT